jgi:exonuclease VII large subunit
LLRRFDPLQHISEQRQKLDDLMQRATYSLLRRVELQRAHLSERLARMEGLDARRVLARGFAVVQDHASGERIRSIAQLSAGQALAIHLADGGARADIINTDLDRS